MSDKVAFFDIATALGWAVGDGTDGPYRYGAITFTRSSRGARYLEAAQWFQGFIKLERPALVVYEAPMIRTDRGERFANIATPMVLLGLAAICEMICQQLTTPCMLADVGDVRQHFIGSRNMKREDAKRATITRCKQLGMIVGADDNKADAIAGLDYVLACRKSKTATGAGPLFSTKTAS